MFAEGKQADAIAAMSAVADAEDKTDKSAVTPGPLAPAREMFGFMLLEAGRAKEALVAFEAVAKKEPNRFLALYGAGKAAEATKQQTKAKGYYRQIVAMSKLSDGGRQEVSKLLEGRRHRRFAGGKTDPHAALSRRSKPHSRCERQARVAQELRRERR